MLRTTLVFGLLLQLVVVQPRCTPCPTECITTQNIGYDGCPLCDCAHVEGPNCSVTYDQDQQMFYGTITPSPSRLPNSLMEWVCFEDSCYSDFSYEIYGDEPYDFSGPGIPLQADDPAAVTAPLPKRHYYCDCKYHPDADAVFDNGRSFPFDKKMDFGVLNNASTELELPGPLPVGLAPVHGPGAVGFINEDAPHMYKILYYNPGNPSQLLHKSSQICFYSGGPLWAVYVQLVDETCTPKIAHEWNAYNMTDGSVLRDVFAGANAIVILKPDHKYTVRSILANLHGDQQLYSSQIIEHPLTEEEAEAPILDIFPSGVSVRVTIRPTQKISNYGGIVRGYQWTIKAKGSLEPIITDLYLIEKCPRNVQEEVRHWYPLPDNKDYEVSAFAIYNAKNSTIITKEFSL